MSRERPGPGQSPAEGLTSYGELNGSRRAQLSSPSRVFRWRGCSPGLRARGPRAGVPRTATRGSSERAGAGRALRPRRLGRPRKCSAAVATPAPRMGKEAGVGPPAALPYELAGRWVPGECCFGASLPEGRRRACGARPGVPAAVTGPGVGSCSQTCRGLRGRRAAGPSEPFPSAHLLALLTPGSPHGGRRVAVSDRHRSWSLCVGWWLFRGW